VADHLKISGLRTLIVVPAYNEANRLRTEPFRTFCLANPSAGFMFVDDGSTDATALRLRDLVDQVSGQIALRILPHNCGKAEAVRQGVLTAATFEPRYIGYWDADLATPLDAITDLERVLTTHPAVHTVLGSRVKLLGRSIDRLPSRHYLGRVFATAASLILRLPVYDTQCGAKLFRVSGALIDQFKVPFRSRWIFDVELLARLSNLKDDSATGGIYEYPLLEWRDVGESRLRLRDYLVAPTELIMIYWHYFRPSFFRAEGSRVPRVNSQSKRS
jgi:dolichyl-phosphate beta-glucosyltransferase